MVNESVYAVIPCYNTENTIVKVINGLIETVPGIKIIIVDDGSVDNTLETIQEYKEIICLRNKVNQGKGNSLKKGISLAIRLNANVILTIDSDGQHNPYESVKLLNKLKQGNFDLVIGSRMHDLKNMPLPRIVSNLLTSKLIALRLKKRIVDSQSGYRVYRTNALKNIKLQSNKFDFESEVLIKLGINKCTIVFENIQTIYLDQNKSSIKFVDIYRFLRIYFNSFLWKGNCLCYADSY